MSRPWTLVELAQAIGVTPDSLRQRIARGTLRADRRGPIWLVPEREAQRVIRGDPAPIRRPRAESGVRNQHERTNRYVRT